MHHVLMNYVRAQSTLVWKMQFSVGFQCDNIDTTKVYDKNMLY